MSPEDTLAFQERNRTRQMTIAAGGGILFMIASVLGIVGPHASVNEATLSLIVQHQRATLAIVAALVNAIAEVLIGVTLIYLWRCATVRVEGGEQGRARPNGRSIPLIPVVVVLGVLVAVVGGVAYAFEISSRSSQFVSSGAQTYDEAIRVTGGSLLLVLQILSQIGALLIAISFVFVSLVSMRVGLLPRFLGYVGVIAGILVLFPIIVVPIVELYWLAAVAILLSGNWPSGLPPAWRSGRAEPWPPAAEMRARRMAEAEAARDRRTSQKQKPRRGGRRTPGGEVAAPARADSGIEAEAPGATAEPVAAGDDGGAARQATQDPGPRRRKRKRRH